MPELPEVEVTRLGIQPHLEGQRVSAVKIIDGRLRWPVPSNLNTLLKLLMVACAGRSRVI